MNRLRRQTTRLFERVTVFTNTAMLRLAKTYSTCLRSLRRAGDPGRFQPVARVAHRACVKLDRAAAMMKEAVALESAGIYSQADADKYNSLVDRALEAQGNAINLFERAKARAEKIRLDLGS